MKPVSTVATYYSPAPCTMRHIRNLLVSLFYFSAVIWFMYVSVELLAERSSSLAAMELAFRLHQERNHPENRLHPNHLPAGPDDMDEHRNVQALFAGANVRKDPQGLRPPARTPEVVNVVPVRERQAGAIADANANVQHEQLPKARLGLGLGLGLAGDGGGIRGGGRGGDSAVQMKVVEQGQRLAEQEPVQFPRYVEEWGPDFPGELIVVFHIMLWVYAI